MKNLLSIFLMSLLVIVATCKKGPENKAQVEEIDGVTHIHNSESPLYPQRTVIFEEELSIGGEDDSGNIILYQPSRYAVDVFGNIFISDSQESVIKKFDPDGHYLKTIGAKGEGPGEFQNITAIAILPDRRLIVLDWRARRTSIFSAEGEYQSSYKWRTSHFDINFVTESTYTIDERVYGEETFLYVKTYDFNGTELLSFGKFAPAGSKTFTQGGNSFSISLPYPPRSTFAGDRTRQWLYHCFNDKYLIEVFDHYGKLVRKIDRPYEPPPFADKDADEYIDGFDDNPESPFAKMAREVEMPSVKTVTERMLVDEEGRLWVETNEEQERENRTFIAYDIFNSEGYYEDRIWSDIRPGLFANEKMYRMETDEDTGYRSLKRFQIIWKNKSD